VIVQNEIASIAWAGMGLVALGFAYVVSQAGRPSDAAQAQAAYASSNRLRRWLFAGLLIIGIGVSYATLRHFPIPRQHAQLQAAQVVDVVSRQWSWTLSAAQIKADVPIEFRVTSDDVNHGFAVYAPDDRIVVQTQAMPGFTNKILHTFHDPGKYRILCLEYCGLAHHGMLGEFDVVAADGARS